MDTSFQSPIQKKDISIIKDYVYNESNYQLDTISGSKEQFDPSSDPSLDTHITNKIQKLSIRPITFEHATARRLIGFPGLLAGISTEHQGLT